MIEIIPNWHPVLVHFTVALLSVSALFFLVSKFAVNWRLEDQWLSAGYWTLWLGALITIGTVIAGYIAFNSVEHDTPSHEVMLEHRNLAFGTLGLYLVLAIWAVLGFRAKKEPSVIFVLVLVLSTGLLFATAWHGAELVYRHGLGVMSLPNPDDHGHAGGTDHAHGEGETHEDSGAAAPPSSDHPHDADAGEHAHDEEASSTTAPTSTMDMESEQDSAHGHDDVGGDHGHDEGAGAAHDSLTAPPDETAGTATSASDEEAAGADSDESTPDASGEPAAADESGAADSETPMSGAPAAETSESGADAAATGAESGGHAHEEGHGHSE